MRLLTEELPEAYVETADSAVEALVTGSLPYLNARSIFVYVSMEKEPSTRKILLDAWSRGKKVYVPKCREKPYMDAVEINGFGDLSPGTMGILEPVSDASLDNLETLDLAIVPCVSAGQDGSRLGHGAAYYDVFLSKVKAVKMCLCYEAVCCGDIPMNEHDVWMDFLVTEKGIVQCSSVKDAGDATQQDN